MTQTHPTTHSGPISAVHCLLKQAVQEHLRVPLHRNTYLMIANLMVTFLSGIVFWILAARLMLPADLGIANAFLAPAVFLTSALLLGTNHGLLRFSKETVQDKGLLFSVIWITLLVSLVGSLIGAGILLSGKVILPVEGSALISLILFAVIVPAGVTWTLCEAVFVGLRAPLQLLARNTGFGVLRILILVPFSSLGATGLLAAYAAGVGLAAFLSMDLIRRYVKPSWKEFFTIRHPAVRQIMRFSLPNHLANLIAGVPAMLLPLIVFHLLGPEMNGYFSLAWTVTMVARTVLTASSATLLSEGVQDQDVFGRKIGRTLAFLAGIVGITVLPMLLLPRWIMFPFGPAYMQNNSHTLPLLAASILPSILTTVFVAGERIVNRSRSILLLSIFSGVLGSVLPYWGALRAGYTGFAVAYLLSQGISGVVVLPFILRALKKRRTVGECL